MRKLIILQLLVMFFAPTIKANHITFVEEKHIWSEVSPDKKTEIAANMRQARHFMEKGDYVSAKKKLERVLELDEEHAEALRLLEECNGMIEQQREAERKALQNAIDAGSVKALQDFIAQYPKSEFVSHAESCIVDFELWNKARQKDTKAAYQNYLDTSTVLGFKNEAESAIVRFETEEAWDECHNSNSIIKLESFMEKYPNSSHVREAEYEVNLLEAAKYYKQNSRSLSLSYYEKANAYRSLTGSHRKCYDELLQEATYERLMDSDDLDDMQRFLRQLSLDSPYYTPISNRIAIIKAQELTVNSTQEDMDGAMSYAMDDGTKSAVKRYISDIKKCQREKRRIARKDRRKAWWEDRATLGWSIVTADIDPMLNIELEDLYYGSLNSSNYPSTCSLSTGLRLRFGRYNDLLNFTIGAGWHSL